MKVWINRGHFMQEVDPSYRLLDVPLDFTAPWDLVFQVYERDGTPAVGSYRGEGEVIRSSGEKDVLLLGDAQSQATLYEYLIDKEPTADSVARYEEFKSGLESGWDTRRRRSSKKSLEWREGFDLARSAKTRMLAGNPERSASRLSRVSNPRNY